MDYTTLSDVKAVLDAVETADDTLLARCITAASRAIDRRCTGVPDSSSDDYFKLETVTDEQPRAMVNSSGQVVCWPRKPVVSSVTQMDYRTSPLDNWTTIPATSIVVDRHLVLGWLELTRQPVQVKITYTGGLAADTASLPADLVEAATVLAVRFYREARTGLGDTIGVAELGTLQYTKAMPARVVEMLKPYRRVAPW